MCLKGDSLSRNCEYPRDAQFNSPFFLLCALCVLRGTLAFSVLLPRHFVFCKCPGRRFPPFRPISPGLFEPPHRDYLIADSTCKQ